MAAPSNFKNPMTAVAIIPAAGESRRMGFDKTKRLLVGVPLIVRTVRRLIECKIFSDLIIAVPAGSESDSAGVLLSHGLESVRVVAGGVTRVHSVWNALHAVQGTPDVVAIHDGARPFVSVESVRASLDAATVCGGAVVATRVVPTIKVADERGCVAATPDRSTLWAAGTPQSFRYAELVAAFDRFWTSNADPRFITDDATIFAAAGGTVKLVEGNIENIKITTPLDWQVAELLCHCPQAE